MSGKIVVGQVSAVIPHKLGGELGNGSLVKGITALLRNLRQSRGQSRITEDLPLPRGAPADRESLPKTRLIPEYRHAPLPIVGNQLAHRKARLRRLDGRGEDLLHGELAKPPVQCKPAVDAPGNRDGQRTFGGNEFRLLTPQDFAQLSQRKAPGRSPARIQPVELPGPGLPHHREQVPPDPAPGRFHQSQGRIGRNGGIHRAPARFQHVQRNLRRKWLAGGRHPSARDHLGSCREGFAGDAIGHG